MLRVVWRFGLNGGAAECRVFPPNPPGQDAGRVGSRHFKYAGHCRAVGGCALFKRKGLHNIQAKEAKLTRHFYSGVRKWGNQIYGDFDNPPVRCPPIVSLNVGDLEAGLISDVLAEKHEIYTRPGAHCAPLVHKALGTTRQGVVRFSFSHLNTIEELDLALGGALAGIVERFAVR